MPRISKALLLPPEARKTLDDLLRKSKGGDLVKISAQMAERGYVISKSAISRYVLEQRNPLDHELLGQGASAEMIHLRLHSYTIAVSVLEAKDHESISRRANQILGWASE